MHLLLRETRSLDETEEAIDLGQEPADLVFLSFSDSDLGAAAKAWELGGLPSLRLANLAALRHPLSVDLYLERTASKARAVVVRLLGGLDYWRYGAEELARTCRAEGIALALVPGDVRDDPRLAELSTVPAATLARLDRLLSEGGPENLARALRLAAHAGGLNEDRQEAPQPLPRHGTWRATARRDSRPLAVMVFYRAFLLAGDTAPLEALADELEAQGFDLTALYLGSLKDPESAAWIAALLAAERPAVVLNATAFSARRETGGSPLDAADCPVLQLLLAGSGAAAWQESSRGLSAADLAMHVVLPELDGRLATPPLSFKEQGARHPDLQLALSRHQPWCEGITAVAARAAAWARLAATPRAERQLALVVSDYPGAAGQVAHAVGLDTLASIASIATLLREAGYAVEESPDTALLAGALATAALTPLLSLADYRRLFATLPAEAQARVLAAWGEPETDPDVIGGSFAWRIHRNGRLLAAVQPDRGKRALRKASYHDPDLPPCHGYLAFYLWLREAEGIHALLHLGTHGTLEWLPGKAAALSDACFPQALLGALPLLYPFIVNNPGEAGAAKRRLGAVTLGHLTPPLRTAGTHGPAAELERLIDEYAAADGLDRRRMALLRKEILARAADTGLLEECGIARDLPEDEALTRLDAYLCDVKELQIQDGLHVFGQAPDGERRERLLDALATSCPTVGRDELATRLDASAPAEAAGLLAALDGRFVAPGPSGAPTRGRADVLPTGRNLTTLDPRAVPTRSAWALGQRAAAELLRRHLQDQGDYPRGLVLDLWGSSAMRTGGDELALALALIGAEPLWDQGSNRVTGVEILPLARLDRPRIDVTLRISGLFRDVFQSQILLFDQAVQAVAQREEGADFNPLAAACRGLTGEALRTASWRIFGAAPGDYGAGVTALLDAGSWSQRDELGRDYLMTSGFAYGQGGEGIAAAREFSRRVAEANAFVHLQDHREIDLLEQPAFSAHEGGFAAAAALLGATPALYHADTANPDKPVARTLAEELARVVRGRAANPAWVAGMRRHGYRGASEIARSVEGLFAFAATTALPLGRQFDQLYQATLGDAETAAFLAAANPAARDAMARRFEEAVSRGLWQPRRNAVAGELAAVTEAVP